jgi:hypothetical protein
MPLSKKYYQMIADVLKGVREDLKDIDTSNNNDNWYSSGYNEAVREIARRLGDQFNADNPRFDFSRWEKWIFNQFPHVRKDQK